MADLLLGGFWGYGGEIIGDRAEKDVGLLGAYKQTGTAIHMRISGEITVPYGLAEHPDGAL